MAAEVSSMEGKREMVTRDLLGGCSAAAVGRKDDHLDLSLKVTSGWQNQLDLLKRAPNPLNREPQELNLLLRDSSGLGLQLVGPTETANRVHPAYASVCTLEKVKSALERAGRVPQGFNSNQHLRRDGGGLPSPSAAPATSSSSSSITSSSSMKRRAAEREEESVDGGDSSAGVGGGGMMVAGCPRCLMYVLISKRSPRCPRCDSHVPVPVLAKKPRIDLNF